MIKNILYYLIFFLFISPINCSEDERNSLLGENKEPIRSYLTLSTEKEISDDITPALLNRENPHLIEAEEVDSQLDAKKRGYIPANDLENDLFKYMDRTAFKNEDPILAKLLRWGGRGFGFIAENATTAMILYVILDLIDISKDHKPYDMGGIDIVITVFMMTYLFLPAVENMAQAGQDLYEFFDNLCNPTPPIPKEYRAINPYSALPLSLNIGSKFHAASMALILTTVFHHIENSKVANYDWFFLTCFFPYALAVSNKNKSYFDHSRKMQKIYQRFESKVDRNTRKILEASYKKFEEELPNLSHRELKKIYLFIKDTSHSPSQKDRNLQNIDYSNAPLTLPVNSGNAPIDDIELSRHTSPHLPSRSIWDELPKQASNLIFYGSTISEYFFYQFGIGLLCERLGITSPLATDILSYGGAAILSTLSFIFEDTSIGEYYETIFQRSFGSSHSMSNLKLRKGIGVKSFTMGILLALSEVYPAWKATLSSGPAAWPFLVFMVARRHAPNALWLQQGYDQTISDWHDRDCWRNNCYCKSCKKGENDQEMINYISATLNKLKDFRDNLNADAIRIIYKSRFDHIPQND